MDLWHQFEFVSLEKCHASVLFLYKLIRGEIDLSSLLAEIDILAKITS